VAVNEEVRLPAGGDESGGHPHLLGCTLPLSGSGRKRGGGGDWTRRCLLSSTLSSPSPSPEAAVASFGADEAHLQGRLHTAEAGVAGSCGVTASRRCDRKLLWQELAGVVLDEVARGLYRRHAMRAPAATARRGSRSKRKRRLGSGRMRTQASFSPTTRRFPLTPRTQLDEAPVVLGDFTKASEQWYVQKGIELDILDGNSNKAMAAHAAKNRQQEPLEQTPQS
jgi:hypothetical protein